MAEFVAKNVAQYARFRQNAALYLPGGRPVAVGEHFVQPELAATLQHMVDEEKAHAGRGRAPGSRRRAPPSTRATSRSTIAAYHREHGGWLTAERSRGYRSTFEPPVRTTYGGVEVYHLRPVVPGPLLGQILAILDGIDIGPHRPQQPALYARPHRGDEARLRRPRGVLRRPALRRRAARAAALARRSRPSGAGASTRTAPAPRMPRERHSAPRRSGIRAAAQAGARAGALAGHILRAASSTGTATPSRRRRATPPTIRRSSPGLGLCPSSRGSQSGIERGASERGRAGQAPAPDAEPGARDPRRTAR